MRDSPRTVSLDDAHQSHSTRTAARTAAKDVAAQTVSRTTCLALVAWIFFPAFFLEGFVSVFLFGSGRLALA